MKKLLSALLIVSLVFSSYKDAEAVAIPVAAVVVGATLLVAAGATQYYNNPAVAASAASAVSTAGNYYRAVDAYTSAATAYGQKQLYKDAATLAVAGQAIIDAVKNAADGMFTALKSLLAPTSSPTGLIPNNTYMTLDSGQSIEVLFYLRDEILYLPRPNPYVKYVGPGYGDIYFPSGSSYEGDQGLAQNYKVYPESVASFG